MSASNDVYQTPLNSRYASKSFPPPGPNEGTHNWMAMSSIANGVDFQLVRHGDEVSVLSSHAILDMAPAVDLARRVPERYENQEDRRDESKERRFAPTSDVNLKAWETSNRSIDSFVMF
jgi:hypothetical protein